MITDYKDLEPGSLYEVFNEKMIFIECLEKKNNVFTGYVDDTLCSFFSLESNEKYTFIFRRIIASSPLVKLC